MISVKDLMDGKYDAETKPILEPLTPHGEVIPDAPQPLEPHKVLLPVEFDGAQWKRLLYSDSYDEKQRILLIEVIKQIEANPMPKGTRKRGTK